MSKVPCGGFELDESLALNNGKLGLAPGAGGGLPSGGTPYQQLVTGGDGTVKWEDRLAYEGSRLVVASGLGDPFVQVTDEVPSWLSKEVTTKVWTNGGSTEILDSNNYLVHDNGSFIDSDYYVAVITEDNSEFSSESSTLLFPKKGVYFSHWGGGYIAGIASADSDTPEITWNGNIGEIKKIDEKFLPDMLILYVHNNAGGAV